MKKIIYLALLIVMTFSISLPVMAKTDKCGKDGCRNENDKNGTIYCDTHAAQYARKQGYKVCCYSGCYRKQLSKGLYCSNHTCSTKDCYSKATSSSGKYCTSHDPAKKKSTTTKKYTSTKKSTSKTSSKKKSSLERYDEGYEDVYENEDYDWDRYWSDDDYADGVDDAMDELDW